MLILMKIKCKCNADLNTFYLAESCCTPSYISPNSCIFWTSSIFNFIYLIALIFTHLVCYFQILHVLIASLNSHFKSQISLLFKTFDCPHIVISCVASFFLPFILIPLLVLPSITHHCCTFPVPMSCCYG